MKLESSVPHDAIAKLWKDALGGEARWNAIPNGELPLDNPFVQMAAMAHWVAERAIGKTSDPKVIFKSLKDEWAADIADSPSARFATYRTENPNETCNPHDEAQVTALLNRALRPTVH